MPSYILTKKAVDDLSRIWDYTFDNWSEDQADKYYYQILKTCEDIGLKKLSGKKYPEVHPEVLGYRTGQHIIFYRRTKAGLAEIARIIHSRMDLSNRFEE